MFPEGRTNILLWHPMVTAGFLSLSLISQPRVKGKGVALSERLLLRTGSRCVGLCFWKPQRPSGREWTLGLEAAQTPGKSNIPGRSEAALTGELHTLSSVAGTLRRGCRRHRPDSGKDARLPPPSFSDQRTAGSPGAGLQTTPPVLIGSFEIGGSARRRTAAAAVGPGNARTHAQIEPEAPRRDK